MGVASWLFGGDVDKVIDHAASGLDALVFTDEEKSKAGQKILDWKLKYLTATAHQSLARRLIAVSITGLWIVLNLTGVIAKGFGADAFAGFVFETLKENVNTPFSIVLGFYFLAHITKGIGRKS